MKATLYVREDPALLGNKIFSDEPVYGMKSDTYLYAVLRDELAQRGVELATQDVHPVQESNLIICLDQPLDFQGFQRSKPGQLLHLVLSEPSTYYPQNWQAASHGPFDKVFTYDYSRVDNKKYFHYYFAIDFDSFPAYQRPTEAEFNARKLCVLMAAAFGVVKPPKGSGSLLHERYLTMKWFSDHHPSDLDLYSRGINPKTYMSFRGAGVLGKLLPASAMEFIAARRRKVFERVYRGSAPPDQKIQTLQRYRFPISYENTGDTPGCLSEKIFDAFAAGCVPIYLGHPDVTELVPANCFINRRDFRSHEELYRFLKSMGYADYAKYLDNIEAYLASSKVQQLSPQANARSMADMMTQPR